MREYVEGAGIYENVSSIPTEPDPLYPRDIFTLDERRNGAIILHIVGVIYMFIALTMVYLEFLVPSLESVIEKYKVKDDISASIFMAFGLNATQFFISLFGLFISFDQIGFNTIMGASVFRILFVIGMCAICSRTVLYLKWFTMIRDFTFYGISLFLMLLFLHDRLIYWWEAVILFLIYLFYMGFVVLTPHLPKKVVLPCCTISAKEETEAPTTRSNVHVQEMDIIENGSEIAKHLPRNVLKGADMPKIISGLRLVTFPVYLPLRMTLPDLRKPRHNTFTWFLVIVWSFFGSILWVALFSYLLMWWANMISETFDLTPEMMGFTFLAAGSSIPNLIWAVMVTRKGLGDLAVSCSIGSNIFTVTFCLPIPWLLYNLWFMQKAEVYVNGIACLIAIVITSLKIVTVLLGCFRWRMVKGFGVIMISLYFIVIVISLLLEYRYIVCPY